MARLDAALPLISSGAPPIGPAVPAIAPVSVSLRSSSFSNQAKRLLSGRRAQLTASCAVLVRVPATSLGDEPATQPAQRLAFTKLA